MLRIVHDWLNEQWDKTGLSLEKIRSRIVERHNEQSISVSKIHRIFSDPDCKVSIDDILLLSEAFDADPNELFAKIGGREYAASKGVDYKGAETLLREFAQEREQMRAEFAARIDQSIEARKETQRAFDEAIAVFQTTVGHIEEQYRKNADYLTGLVERSEKYNAQLTERAVRAEEAAAQAEARADSAEQENRATRKKLYKLFFVMLGLLIAVFAFLMFIMIADVPYLGGGNG